MDERSPPRAIERLGLALVARARLGLERERRHEPARPRTDMQGCQGAALSMTASPMLGRQAWAGRTAVTGGPARCGVGAIAPDEEERA